MRGAVACLGPGLEADPETHRLLAAVLTALKRRVVEYNQWIGDEGGVMALDSAAVDALRYEMTRAHSQRTFSHKAYAGGWLLTPAIVASYRSLYGEHTYQWDEYFRTGI